MEKFIPIHHQEDEGRDTEEDGQALGALRRSGCPHGCCCIFGKTPEDGSVPAAAETRHGVAQERKPRRSCCCGDRNKKGNEPGQQVSMAQKKSTLHTKGALSPLRERQDVSAGGPGLSWDNK